MSVAPKGRLRRLLPRSSAALIIVALLAGGWFWYRSAVAPVAMQVSPMRFVVPKGAGVRTVAAALRRQGVGVTPTGLWLWYKWRGLDGQLKAGTYEFTAPITVDALLGKMARGEVLIVDIRFIEGWTFKQMRAAVDAHPDLLHETRGLDDAALLQKIGASYARPEGLFFPDTYTFSPGFSDLELYKLAHRNLQQALDAAWQARADALPYRSPYEALIMASIIEKETGRADERDKVAAVFVNRLKRGMLLQSDPTTIYGLGAAFDGNLRKRDLQADTAFNTYTRAGLPPTPIALAGRASLQAALRPADSTALYFVARGDGSSEFSDDLASHNRAVWRYQKGGR